MRYILYLCFLFLLQACNTDGTPSNTNTESDVVADSAIWIVDKAIERHGRQHIDQSHIEFDFRDRHYIAKRDGGKFSYERIWTDTTSGDAYRDILNNEKLSRQINGERVELTAKDSSAYANSVNSVIYFALIPYFLNDAAVRKSYLGTGSIKGNSYHKIKVTFRQEGGGKDYDDEFIYWVHSSEFTVDYFAYNYIVDGGGARFRQAYNPREIGGIRFADYVNYEPVPDNREVEHFDALFEAGKLKELSRIDLEEVEVR